MSLCSHSLVYRHSDEEKSKMEQRKAETFLLRNLIGIKVSNLVNGPQHLSQNNESWRLIHSLMGHQTLPTYGRQMRHNLLYIMPENPSFFDQLKQSSITLCFSFSSICQPWRLCCKYTFDFDFIIPFNDFVLLLGSHYHSLRCKTIYQLTYLTLLDGYHMWMHTPCARQS